jgi:RimJ/RimL family protein N-acetyltransferase
MIQLKQVVQSDVPVIAAWSKKTELAEYFRRMGPSFSWNNQTFALSYLIREEETPVGIICLSNIDQQNKKFECGILVECDDKQKRQAISVEAYDQLFDFFFNHLGYNRAEVTILSHRAALSKRLEQLGFQIEGISRQSAFFQGSFLDEIRFSYLAETYRSRLQGAQSGRIIPE